MRPARHVIVVIAILLAALATPTPATHAGAAVAAPAGLLPHAPIDIESNAAFTPSNGVVSGSGTAADPYVISGWSIDASPGIGVQIRNTNVHVAVRDVQVTGAPVDGLYFYAVSNMTLSNVTAEFNPGEGIRFESSHSIAILGGALAGNHAGLVLLNSADAVVRGANLSLNSGDGVTVSGSPNVTLESNNVSYNGLGGSGYGIDLAYTTGDTVRGNRFTASGIFLAGDALAHFDSHTITADNLVSGVPILYAKDCNGLGLTGMDVAQILLAGCAYPRISDVTVTGGDVGVEIAFSSHAVVGPGVTISNAAVGIQVTDSSSVQVVDSQILDTAVGVAVEASTGVQVVRTKISAPFPATGPYDGITIHNSDRVNVSASIIRHHRYGIVLQGSGNISLVQNTVGLDVLALNASTSRNVYAVDNLLTQDSGGIRVASVTNATFVGNALLAIFTTGVNVSASSGVRFIHNVFGGARNNAYDAQGTSDTWDGGYPTGGNYWANYRGPDLFHGPGQNLTGPDGIGDVPYSFDVGAEDHYPLMSPPVTADVPPEAIALVAPAQGTVLTPFRMTANLSSDLEDVLGLLQVRWSWDGGGNWTGWSAVKFASHLFGTPGVQTISLEVRDTTGLTDNWSVQVLVLPKPDTIPPAILCTPPASVEMGQPIPVVANITDESGIANATLLYRGVDGGPIRSLPMQIENNGTNFTATIPAQPHAGTVDYVIVANDTWENEARAPVTGVSSIRIVDTFTPMVLGLALAAILISAVAIAFVLLRRRRKRIQAAPSPPPVRPPGNP